MKTDQRIDKGISDIVGVFCDPIIASPEGWADSLPDWLKHAITLERLIENMRALGKGDMTGTDAEACAYLFTASLERPLGSDWTDIYLYIANQVYNRHRSKELCSISAACSKSKVSAPKVNYQESVRLWVSSFP